MTIRRWIGGSLVVLLAAAACSGDDLVPYFERVEQITIDLEERRQDLPETTDIESARVFFSGLIASDEISSSEFSSLEAPESARGAHDTLVEIRTQLRALNRRISERLDTIDSVEQFDALASDSELGILPHNTLVSQLGDACRDLQAVADEHGIEVSLRCGQE